MVSKWILVLALGLEAHFAASYLVPLDAPSQREFGGLLRWFWPWAYGDAGALGQITPEAGFPVTGFFLAMVAGGALLIAALAAAGWWVPSTWWPLLAIIGAAFLLVLMVVFISPTKVGPILFALATLYMAVSRPALFATS